MPTPPRPATEDLTQRLEQALEVEFTLYRVESVASELALCPHDEQEFALEWTQRIAAANTEIAWRFAQRISGLLPRMDRHLIEAWGRHAMDAYDRDGLRPALLVIERVDDFARLRHPHGHGVLFEEVEGVLGVFARGLSGRRLRLQRGDAAWTDGETLYLPPLVGELAEASDNFRLAKAWVAVLWAQTRFGSFREDVRARLNELPDAAHALRALALLETLRLSACIARELPGLSRDIRALRTILGQDVLPPPWAACADHLSAPSASLRDSLDLLKTMAPYDLPELCIVTELRPDAVWALRSERIEREKRLLRVRLAQLTEESPPEDGEGPTSRHFELDTSPNPLDPLAHDLVLDGKPLPPPDTVRALLTSIWLDLGEIPPDYLVPAGPGEYDPALYESRTPDPDAVWQGTYHEVGALHYDEWDFARRTYRRNWCVMREKDVVPVHDGFVATALAKHRAAVHHLRRTFEAMREGRRLQRRQPWGDAVDLDALIEAIADARSGDEMTERLFMRTHRIERDIAAIFMVDMSGSTRGWINEAERETLVLLCEALESLGDRYAIYGFSGITRKRCELYRIKRFNDAYDDEVRARISGVRPQDYTRMGFAIRHLTRVLQETGARTRLLVTLSDGRPEDYNDNYRGRYGVEDTRQALVEARRAGVHPFCITLDTDARDYLPHMYGAAQYVVIDDVKQLPLKVPGIYRALTT